MGGYRADHSSPWPPPTCPAQGSRLQGGGLRSQPTPASRCCHSVVACRGCRHHRVPPVGGTERGHMAGPWHLGPLSGRRGLPSPPAISSPLSDGDAGLRVTLTLLPAGPGLGGRICSSLSVKGEPEKPLGSPQAQDPNDSPGTWGWAGPVPPTPSQWHAGLGDPLVRHQAGARMGPSPHAVLLTGLAQLGMGSLGTLGLGGAVGLSRHPGLAGNRTLCVPWG